MDADRIWKWAERMAVVVIAPLSAVAGAYFAAGTYYGWDKQAVPVVKDRAGGLLMTLPPWLGFALLGAAILSLLTGWGMIVIRLRSRKLKERQGKDGAEATSHFSDDPRSEAVDPQAYNQIVAFCIDHLLPACDAQIQLQKALIRRLCPIEPIAELAIHGAREDWRYKTRGFWENYSGLSSGLTDSPGPSIKFEGIIECISELEREFYRNFFEQTVEIGRAGQVEPNSTSGVFAEWHTAREQHGRMVKAFEQIKRDIRFGKLHRLKPSRWGEIN